MPRNSDSAVLAGTACAKQWLVTWQNSEEHQPEQIREGVQGRGVSIELLRHDARRWNKVKGPTRSAMCASIDAGWLPPHRFSW